MKILTTSIITLVGLIIGLTMFDPIVLAAQPVSARLFEVTTESEFARLVKREQPRRGDVIILSQIHLKQSYMLIQAHLTPSSFKGEPTYIVGRKHCER